MSNKRTTVDKILQDGCALLDSRYRAVALAPFSEDIVEVFQDCLYTDDDLTVGEDKFINKHISKLCLSHLYMQTALNKLILFDDPTLKITFKDENPFVTAKICGKDNHAVILSSVFNPVDSFTQHKSDSMELSDLAKVKTTAAGIDSRTPSHVLVNDTIDAIFRLHLKSASSYFTQYKSSNGHVTRVTSVIKDSSGKAWEFRFSLMAPLEYYESK